MTEREKIAARLNAVVREAIANSMEEWVVVSAKLSAEVESMLRDAATRSRAEALYEACHFGSGPGGVEVPLPADFPLVADRERQNSTDGAR